MFLDEPRLVKAFSNGFSVTGAAFVRENRGRRRTSEPAARERANSRGLWRRFGGWLVLMLMVVRITASPYGWMDSLS